MVEKWTSAQVVLLCSEGRRQPNHNGEIEAKIQRKIGFCGSGFHGDPVSADRISNVGSW